MLVEALGIRWLLSAHCNVCRLWRSAVCGRFNAGRWRGCFPAWPLPCCQPSCWWPSRGSREPICAAGDPVLPSVQRGVTCRCGSAWMELTGGKCRHERVDGAAGRGERNVRESRSRIRVLPASVADKVCPSNHGIWPHQLSLIRFHRPPIHLVSSSHSVAMGIL